MRIISFFVFVILLGLQACIGDDFVMDEVDPVVQITNSLDTLAMDSVYQFEANYFNNIGQPENVDIVWTSNDSQVISISESGLATGIAEGSATITATVDNGMQVIEDAIEVAVGASNVSEPVIRTGRIVTTSSYVLTGDFRLIEDGENVIIDIADDYRASSALPGLFIYLTNNPNTTSGALELGEVRVFSGAHQYEVEGIDIMDYNHILYFCKPFNVKVGGGAIED